MKEAGCVTVSEIAAHWDVCDSTARDILATAGISAVSTGGWMKYRWEDIWRLEGELFVPPYARRAFQARLLKTPALRERDPRGRSERTMRRYVEQGKIPCIRLTSGVIRVRECTFDAVIHLI